MGNGKTYMVLEVSMYLSKDLMWFKPAGGSAHTVFCSLLSLVTGIGEIIRRKKKKPKIKYMS